MGEDSVPRPGSTGTVDVVVSDRQGRSLDLESLADVATETLLAEGVEGPVELSVVLVAEDEMAELHERYLGEPGPTDVLSFEMDEDGLLGDVVVCPDEAERNNPSNLPLELRLLVVHGILHLLGHDHEEEDQRDAMWALQDRYVPGWREGRVP